MIRWDGDADRYMVYGIWYIVHTCGLWIKGYGVRIMDYGTTELRVYYSAIYFFGLWIGIPSYTYGWERDWDFGVYWGI